MENTLENNKTSSFIQYAKDMLAVEIRKVTALREIIALFEVSQEPVTKASIILDSQFDKIKEPRETLAPPRLSRHRLTDCEKASRPGLQWRTT